MPRVGDIWISIDIGIRNCCTQFYKPKLDTRIKEGDYILRITNFIKDSHMLCWLYCINFYDHLFWRYASKSDVEYNIKIGSNRLLFVEYEEKEDEVEIGKLEY